MDHPANSELGMRKYGEVLKLFKEYIARGELSKTRLRTAMEEIRTYLSLRQQEIATEEQRASKEQLVRLVNLQEIFHKVEIFVVTVYLTEMARIVFEALAREIASMLTVSFIPAALLLAVGIGRLLHRGQ